MKVMEKSNEQLGKFEIVAEGSKVVIKTSNGDAVMVETSEEHAKVIATSLNKVVSKACGTLIRKGKAEIRKFHRSALEDMRVPRGPRNVAETPVSAGNTVEAETPEIPEIPVS